MINGDSGADNVSAPVSAVKKQNFIRQLMQKTDKLNASLNAERKPHGLSVFDIVLLPLLGVIIYVLKLGMSFLPNIHPVCLLILVYIKSFGPKAIISVYIFVLLDMLTYGFVENVSYLYVWLLFALIVLCFKSVNSPLFWAIISAFFGLVFGALTAIPNLILYGTHAAIGYWIAGISFELIHCVSNFIVCMLLYLPFYLLFGTLSKRFYESSNRIHRGK